MDVQLSNISYACCWVQVTYLTIADFSMREELVLKIAILAEKFAPSVEVSASTAHLVDKMTSVSLMMTTNKTRAEAQLVQPASHS